MQENLESSESKTRNGQSRTCWIICMAVTGAILVVAPCIVYSYVVNFDSLYCFLIDAKAWVLISGIAASPSLILTWIWRVKHKDEEIDIAQTNANLAAEKHKHTVEQEKKRLIIERLAKTFELLGDQEPITKIGAILQFERIAKDSPGDSKIIVEYLSAFIRATVPWQDAINGLSGLIDEESSMPPKAEVQAALTLLGDKSLKFADRNKQIVDLRGTYLRNANLSNSSFSSVDFGDSNLGGASFHSACLHKSYLDRARLESASFNNANVRESTMNDAHLERAFFINAVLENVELQKTHLQRAELIGAKFKNVDFRGANLENAFFNKATLENVDLKEAVFKEVDFRDAHFKGVDLSGKDLQSAKLERIHLEDAKLVNAKLMNTDLSGSCLDRANLQEAQLENAILQGAIMKGCKLQRALLNGADLSDANMEGAELTNSYLEKADLRGANLSGVVHFKSAQLKGAIYNSEIIYPNTESEIRATIFPEDFDPREAGMILKNDDI